MRPEWDEVWMRVAHTISERSVDPRYQVGTIIVTEDNTQLLSLGYNGNYKGGPNKVESEVPGQSGLIHAEQNALIKLDYNNPKKKKMYVTLSPCSHCAKMIVNANINEVIYDEEYRDPAGIEIMKSAGLTVRRFYQPKQ
jgi:dCMP deaminase|tara:strand:- start:870 stop:1286 length:417 start_codon:yes stop_codon:yes gene_type:complete